MKAKLISMLIDGTQNVYTALKEVRLGQCAKLVGIVTDMSTPRQTSSGGMSLTVTVSTVLATVLFYRFHALH
ncbi:hypothetical protein GALMADRAFT_251266 [Galerina marginata CBS 339.88]|uniref:Uncharacterized protein n=1 Tax=Galerina marginata (strain CBS 339.88) TaxID=685588 RepID=A0A067SRH8_GALM3|nr:hypothetical protein GALMADRAFT_251266 [Galerina marginata CBS 339.88]